MPFLFFLGLLATSAAVGSMVGLGSDTTSDDDGDCGNSDGNPSDSSSDVQPDESGAVDNGWIFGEDDVDDTLTGTDGADSLRGDAGDGDILEGGAGDDLLWVGEDNTATGGAGADSFFVQADGVDMGAITDFDPSEDTLVIRDFENPVEGGNDSLILTKEDDGVALRNAETGAVHLALPDVELGDGESLSVLFQETEGETFDSDVLHEELRSFTLQDAPYVADALRGTDGADVLAGNEADDVIFGEGGADLLRGGAGDDAIYSGSGSIFYNSEWYHAPGDLNKFGADDTLEGGAGNDTLWIGSGNVANGGADADTFRAVAGVYDEAAQITDFTDGEDRLVVNFGLDGPFGASAQNADNDYFTVEAAASGFEISYDADLDQTTMTLGKHALVVLNGDQTGLTIAFSNQDFADNYGDDDDYEWLDADGNPITESAALSADVLFSGMNPQDMYDANGNAGMIS